MARGERIVALDLGRGTAVFLLVVVHTLWMYGDAETQRASTVGQVLHLLGQFTAAFLVAMGIAFPLSRHRRWIDTVRRGGQLLAIGYGMNALKFLVPGVLGFLPEAFVEAYGWSSPLTTSQWLYLLGTGDILQLAGLASVGMGTLWAAFGPRPLAYVLAALVAALVTYPLQGGRLGIGGFDYGLDLLWGTQFNVYFPVFPWIVPCLTGLAVGSAYVASDRDEDVLDRTILGLGVTATALGGLFVALDPARHFGDFFHMGGFGALGAAGLALLVLGGFRRFAPPASQDPGPVQRFLTYCSARVTSIYVIQWVVVCWGMGLVGYHTLSWRGVLVAIPVTMALTFGVQRLLDEARDRRTTIRTTRTTHESAA